MSLKTKLTSLITTFVLLCSLLTVGVFAVKNTTFNVGGNIEFNVQGIEADIELTTNGVQNAEFNNNEEIGKDVLKKIEIRNNTSAESVASQFAKWSNLDMTFAEGQSTATIELKITNRATEEDNYIDITALADATTKDNAKIKVANNAGGITALLKSGENATFTITFEVKDDEYKASLNDFSVNFDMQKKVKSDFPSYDAVEGLTFSCDTTAKTATLTDGTSAEGEVVIPAYVQKENVVCAVTNIGEEAFCACFDLTSITIPATVTTIENAVFFGCEYLTGVTIGSGVASIGAGAFTNCSILTSIVVESGNSVYDSRNDCNAIIETATNTLMYGCNNTIIPNNLEAIGDRAFYACFDLTSITIPYSVKAIGDQAFYYCSSLTSIVVESGNSVYDSRNNCNAIIETATNTLLVGSINTTIPNTVEIIGDYAFYGSNLISITIPDSVTSISEEAFGECGKLKSITILSFDFDPSAGFTSLIDGYRNKTLNITIKDGTTAIEANAFEECTGLTSITIPDSVTSIGTEAFYGCTGLTNITIPDSVTSIGWDAFARCSNLTTVNFRGTEEQWNALGHVEDFCLEEATINFNYTGE